MGLRIMTFVAIFALVGAACSSVDETTSAATSSSTTSTSIADGDAADPQTTGDDGDGDGDGEAGAGDPAPAGEFETVFPLLAGEVSELFPYQVTDNEFVYSETATFLVAGTDIETVIGYYEALLPQMGYIVGDRIQLGESIAINISDPARPNVTAVMQAGLASPADPTVVQLNMERTENKDAAEDETGEDDDDGDDSSTSSGGDAATSGDDADGGADATDAPALDLSGPSVAINWAALPSSPFFAPPDDGADPFFFIHTNPETDGFYLSLELYTTGYGQQWTGETGTFDISCAEPVNSTGICPYFDEDGPGPIEVLGSDFAATGSLTIVQLDDSGYEIIVHELIFSDGTTFNEFTISG